MRKSLILNMVTKAGTNEQKIIIYNLNSLLLISAFYFVTMKMMGTLRTWQLFRGGIMLANFHM